MFRRKPKPAEAVRLRRPVSVDTPDGARKGKPGDWVVFSQEGDVYVMTDDLFRGEFDPEGVDAVHYPGWAGNAAFLQPRVSAEAIADAAKLSEEVTA